MVGLRWAAPDATARKAVMAAVVGAVKAAARAAAADAMGEARVAVKAAAKARLKPAASRLTASSPRLRRETRASIVKDAIVAKDGKAEKAVREGVRAVRHAATKRVRMGAETPVLKALAKAIRVKARSPVVSGVTAEGSVEARFAPRVKTRVRWPQPSH